MSRVIFFVLAGVISMLFVVGCDEVAMSPDYLLDPDRWAADEKPVASKTSMTYSSSVESLF